jgi:hypothetical protein
MCNGVKFLLKATLMGWGTLAACAAPASPASPGGGDASAAAAGTDRTLVPNNDTGIGSDGEIKDGDSYQVRIGELHAPNGEAYIMPLRIPALPPGRQIATAHLRAQLAGIAHDGDIGSVDLYGLGLRDANKALPADYYEGETPDPKNTLIQAGFLTPQSKVRTDSRTGPFVETTPAGDVALVRYLNEFIGKPGNAGKYLMLRLSYTKHPIPPGNNAYNLLTTGADGDDEIPVITYTLTAASGT